MPNSENLVVDIDVHVNPIDGEAEIDWVPPPQDSDDEYEEGESSVPVEDDESKEEDDSLRSPLSPSKRKNAHKSQRQLKKKHSRSSEDSGMKKRNESNHSEPVTAETAPMSEATTFEFEINLPPEVDVSPLSCKESVIAAMLSRSVDRALDSPPIREIKGKDRNRIRDYKRRAAEQEYRRVTKEQHER